MENKVNYILVTGAAGFIGSHLCEALLKIGFSVVGIDDMSAGKQSNVKILGEYENFTFHIVDITDEVELEKIFFHYEPDVVFHQAASKKNISNNNPHRDMLVNAGGSLSLVMLSVKYKVSKYIHASTGSVYGEFIEGDSSQDENYPLRPVSYYGCSKLLGENYVSLANRVYGLNTTILRYFHVYGERQENDDYLGGVIAIWLKRAKAGLPLIVHGDGEQVRSFTYVGDVVNANIGAMLLPIAKGKIYNCASGLKVSLNETKNMIGNLIGKELDFISKPELDGDIRNFSVDNNKILNELKIAYIGLKEGLQCTISHGH